MIDSRVRAWYDMVSTTERPMTTTFIKLPPHLRKPITYSCECPHCKDHPNREPHWDTLAFDADGNTWVVHYPELKAVEVRG